MEYCNREEVVSKTGVLVGDNSDKLLFEDTRKIGNLVKKFIDYQYEVNKLTPKTVHSYYDGIKRFYMKNSIQLDWDDLSDDVGPVVTGTLDAPYTYEEIHKILEKCDERKRVIIYLLASTGMRRGAIPELKCGDLKYIEEYGIYEITVYKGFKEQYITYCSFECANAIRSYIEFRKRYGEKISSQSYLIRKQFNRESTGKRKASVSLPNDPPHKHKINTSTLETIIYQLICDSGIRDHEGKKSRNGDRYRNMAAHSFRKFFENKCLESGVDPFYVSVLMGHKGRIGIERHYYRPDSIGGEFSLLELYAKKAMPYLTISEESRVKAKNRELEIRLKEENSRFDTLAAQIEALNKRLGLS